MFRRLVGFELMAQYMDGTTSSSLYEARLGYEKFGKEVHAYSVAFSEAEVNEVAGFASKVIFNSASQLQRFKHLTGELPLGLRVNPGMSHSGFELADPVRRYSRLGVVDKQALRDALPDISGVMFHCNCENEDVSSFGRILQHIADNYADELQQLDWVSLGGGIYFTKPGFELNAFCEQLKQFSQRFGVQVYLEPGEASIYAAGDLVTSVLDIVENEKKVAIVDGCIEGHMLDLLIYRYEARIEAAVAQGHEYIVAGRSCLAGDVFGCYRFEQPLEIGSQLRIADAAGYTMVKKNWFNGLQMPAIAVKRLNGEIEVVQSYDYQDYKNSLS